jgi:hypothetical protein
MLYPPRGSPTPGGFFSSKLENEGKPDQPREREDRQTRLSLHVLVRRRIVLLHMRRLILRSAIVLRYYHRNALLSAWLSFSQFEP